MQDRNASQIHRLERAAGGGIMVLWRTNIAHLHRPWRATIHMPDSLLIFDFDGMLADSFSVLKSVQQRIALQYLQYNDTA